LLAALPHPRPQLQQLNTAKRSDFLCTLCMHLQLVKRQRLLDAKRRARRTHEAQLRAALDALMADEAHAQQLVVAAQQTLQDVRSEGFGC
jgi:hypothetical protein